MPEIKTYCINESWIESSYSNWLKHTPDTEQGLTQTVPSPFNMEVW